LCQYNTIASFCQQRILETELGEAMNDKNIYLKRDRVTQLIL